MKVLSNYFVPKRNIAYEKFTFNKRGQKEGECIYEFAIQLKKLAASSDYDKYLDSAQRERLRSRDIQSFSFRRVISALLKKLRALMLEMQVVVSESCIQRA